MASAFFYHLTERPLERALPPLLGKALAAGWRVAIRGTDRARLERLDRVLWEGEGFLPHGLSGGPHDAEQPVLLTTDAEAPNGAVCLMSVDGAAVSAEETRTLSRVCILFDGGDESAVEAARGQWKMLTEAGLAAAYWAEEDGRWVKKAESAGQQE